MKEENKKQSSIGALYPCYKQPKAVFSTLSTFRKFYPSSTIIMINDAGDKKLENLAQHFGCTYLYYDQNVGSGKSLYPKHFDDFCQLISRFMHAFTLIPEEFVLLLEDDVKLLHPIDGSQLVFTLNGAAIHHAHLQQGVVSFLRKSAAPFLQAPKVPSVVLPREKYTYFAGYGGCVFDRRFFTDVMGTPRILLTLKRLHHQFQTLAIETPLVVDQWLSIVVWYSGGSIGGYDGYYETWWPTCKKALEEGKVHILHRYTELYDQALIPEEERVYESHTASPFRNSVFYLLSLVKDFGPCSLIKNN